MVDEVGRVDEEITRLGLFMGKILGQILISFAIGYEGVVLTGCRQ